MSRTIRLRIKEPVRPAPRRHAIGLIGLCAMLACTGDRSGSPTEPDGTATPVVAAVSPEALVEGEVVVIGGTDFSPTASHNVVTIDGVEATVTARVPLYDVSPDDRRFLMVTAYSPRDWRQGDVAYSRAWYWSDEIQAKLRR